MIGSSSIIRTMVAVLRADLAAGGFDQFGKLPRPDSEDLRGLVGREAFDRGEQEGLARHAA